MFSKNTETIKENEKKVELKNFLDNSYELKKIKELAKKSMSHAVAFISDIERCNELTDILYITNDFDFKTTDNIVRYNLGRNVTNVIFFASGFVSDNANLGYYVLHLRENLIERLKKQSGPDFDPSIFSHFIPKSFTPGYQNG